MNLYISSRKLKNQRHRSIKYLRSIGAYFTKEDYKWLTFDSNRMG